MRLVAVSAQTLPAFASRPPCPPRAARRPTRKLAWCVPHAARKHAAQKPLPKSKKLLRLRLDNVTVANQHNRPAPLQTRRACVRLLAAPARLGLAYVTANRRRGWRGVAKKNLSLLHDRGGTRATDLRLRPILRESVLFSLHDPVARPQTLRCPHYAPDGRRPRRAADLVSVHSSPVLAFHALD